MNLASRAWISRQHRSRMYRGQFDALGIMLESALLLRQLARKPRNAWGVAVRGVLLASVQPSAGAMERSVSQFTYEEVL